MERGQDNQGNSIRHRQRGVYLDRTLSFQRRGLLGFCSTFIRCTFNQLCVYCAQGIPLSLLTTSGVFHGAFSGLPHLLYDLYIPYQLRDRQYS